MLFTSNEFIFIFLPIVFFIYIYLRTFDYHRYAIAFLVGASLFYYSWWDVRFLTLISFSIIFNYSIAFAISRNSKRWLLALAILINLGLIGYYKYTGFIIKSITDYFAVDIPIPEITLPLAISFFSFQQIAYLVDSYKFKSVEKNFINYALFVTFFPQLIAGPIVHHKEMVPQFNAAINLHRIKYDLVLGVGIFSMGLFKKLFIADQIAIFADQVFNASQSGSQVGFCEAWCGALAYTFQIYFDFSGYTDMAIGSARIFGIYLPINFYSPYKALNPSDFWARWHVTLSRFLRNYLYFPLGGNRNGTPKTVINLMITMLLGGLWHGANWTFVCWGGIHGCYLVAYHVLKIISQKIFIANSILAKLQNILSILITFTLVVTAWVFFRAENVDSAINILNKMYGIRQIGNQLLSTDFATIDIELFFQNNVISDPLVCILWLIFLLIIVFFFPNTTQIAFYYQVCLTGFDKNNPIWKIHTQHKFILESPQRVLNKYISYPILGALVILISMLMYQSPDNSPFIYTIF